MTATPSVSKTGVSAPRTATPSVHLFRFLPSGSVLLRAGLSVLGVFGLPHIASRYTTQSPHAKAPQ